MSAEKKLEKKTEDTFSLLCGRGYLDTWMGDLPEDPGDGGTQVIGSASDLIKDGAGCCSGQEGSSSSAQRRKEGVSLGQMKPA